MPELLQIFVLIPLAGFLAGLLVPRKKESLLAGITIAAIGVHLAATAVFTGWWIMAGCPSLEYKQIVLYKSPGFEFFIDYYFDRISAVFGLVGAILTALVAIFSRYYMHREEGFKRFFSTLLLFFVGYNCIVFSGNFETLFIGWEILGITSFLLIAFYRDRYLPVKNGFKVLSYYRLGDICLILAMWMSHHLWHKNITFSEWADTASVLAQYQQHYLPVMFVSAMILIAAAIKSAQLPFFTWLPRAMEGPTTSSAIFYGSLAVHVGVFLLLRTYPFWEHEILLKAAVIAIGLSTSLLATHTARVQSSVKTQIAYSSITQIGLIFVEVALGWHMLALVHFAGNAFLRTYQLLVSPSVLNYLIHDMFFNFRATPPQGSSSAFGRVKQAAYVLSIKEWNIDFLLYRYLWSPFKWAGNKLAFINNRWGMAFLALVLVAGSGAYAFKQSLYSDIYGYTPLLFSTIALLMVLTAFVERGDARRAWLLAFGSQFFTALAALWNKDSEWHPIGLFFSGSAVAAVVGLLCLNRIRSMEKDELELDGYHGHSYEQPGIALVFLISCLALSGFPISPAFIGIDLLFTHIHAHQYALAILMAMNFLFLELTIIRIYTRVFMGQHKKAYHPIAFKSS